MPRMPLAGFSVVTPLAAIRQWATGRLLLVAFTLAVMLAGTLPSPVTFAQEATPGALSESTTGAHLDAASAWLRVQQDPSGAFPGFSGDPDPGTTTDAAIALYASRASDPDAAAALNAAVSYLDRHGADYAATGAGQAAKLALAAIAGGRDPRVFASVDLIEAMKVPPTTSTQDPISGIYGDDLYDHALVLIAFAAAGEPVDDAVIKPFRATQNEEGGWAYDGSTEAAAADSNTTALVIQALVASGHGDEPMVDRGLAFLETLIAPDGSGFAYGPADPLVADANSTALALQALIAAGEDPAAPEWGNAPLALARFQTPSGGLRYMAGDEEPNLLATLQAIPAMAAMPLPVAVGCTTSKPPGTDACIPLAA